MIRRKVEEDGRRS